jgi:hypothetical protein
MRPSSSSRARRVDTNEQFSATRGITSVGLALERTISEVRAGLRQGALKMEPGGYRLTSTVLPGDGEPGCSVPRRPAAELPRLSLADALLVVLVFARARAPQTEAAAVRWAARYVAEVRPAPEAREVHLVLSAACALAGAFKAAGRDALHALATRRRLNDLCRALDEWEPPELTRWHRYRRVSQASTSSRLRFVLPVGPLTLTTRPVCWFTIIQPPGPVAR